MEVIVYHNPKCSKSCAALDLITQQGIMPKVIHYLETPIDRVQLKALLEKLDLDARQLLRQEGAYQDLNLSDLNLTEEALIDAMVQHPELIQRPIVEVGSLAVIARPAQKLLAILP